MDGPCYEERDDLLAAAAAEGEDLSDFQLGEWRRRGLVPRPKGRGRGRGRGRQYCYPPGTADLVRRIVRWLRWDRRLDVVAWSLWTDPDVGPATISGDVVADAVDSIIGRYVPIDLWEKEGRPESDRLTETDFFRRLDKLVDRFTIPSAKPGLPSIEASDIAFIISTIARDSDFQPNEGAEGWPAHDEALYEIAESSTWVQALAVTVFQILEPLIRGWRARYGRSDPSEGDEWDTYWEVTWKEVGSVPKARIAEALIAFTGLLVDQRKAFDPRYLGRWLRDSRHQTERLEIQRDLLAMSRALFPQRFGSEPPSPLLLWLLILARQTGVTFSGARDRYGWVLHGDPPDPEEFPELDPLRRVLDAMPVKKTYLRGRPE